MTMKREPCHKILAVFGLTLCATLGQCVAETNTPPKSAFVEFCERDYMLGDWGGGRTWLKDHGVDFEFIYFAAVPTCVDGGLKQGSVYEGGLMMMMDLDSEKLAGYHGGLLHVAGLSIHNGEEFSANYIGDLNKVSMLDFKDNLDLWELWYEQKMFNDKVSVKAGQMAIDRDFIVSEYYNSLAGITLLNQTFFYPTMAFNVWDQPYFPVGHHALSSTPYGSPGVRVRVDPSDLFYVQAGAYAGNIDQERGNIRFKLSGNEGALLYFEGGLKINQTPEAKGPPGSIKVGGYYHTDNFVESYSGMLSAFDTFSGGALSTPPPNGFGLITEPANFTEGNYGFYFVADQTLWREIGKEDPAHQGLVGFFRVATAPKDRNLADLGIDGGLVYKGLIPKRDWDTFAVAFSYLHISEDIADAQRDINAAFAAAAMDAPFTELADYEAVLEISYKAQLTAWFTLQPSVQRVFHPGGYVQGEIPDAWAVIVQAVFRF